MSRGASRPLAVALDMDLRSAYLAAFEIPRGKAKAHALTFTWAKASASLDNIARQILRAAWPRPASAAWRSGSARRRKPWRGAAGALSILLAVAAPFLSASAPGPLLNLK